MRRRTGDCFVSTVQSLVLARRRCGENSVGAQARIGAWRNPTSEDGNGIGMLGDEALAGRDSEG